MCVCVLTQPLAVLRGRSSKTGDPASVTPQVLLLGCRGNVPHLHGRISASEENNGRSENERIEEDGEGAVMGGGRRRKQAKLKGTNRKRFAESEQGRRAVEEGEKKQMHVRQRGREREHIK